MKIKGSIPDTGTDTFYSDSDCTIIDNGFVTTLDLMSVLCLDPIARSMLIIADGCVYALYSTISVAFLADHVEITRKMILIFIQ